MSTLVVLVRAAANMQPERVLARQKGGGKKRKKGKHRNRQGRASQRIFIFFVAGFSA